MNQLKALAEHTVLVADTSKLDEIARFPVQDATTNPSLVGKALEDPATSDLVKAVMGRVRGESADPEQRAARFVDRLFVELGVKILEIVPGRVSTEVPARLSFDTATTIEKARGLIALYAEAGIDRERVLIKIASTWEGIRAAEVLEAEGIHCNMTLLFHLAQAAAAAEAGATLISPFVGRIYDWHKRAEGLSDIPIEKDPGVASVREIFVYLKHFGYPIQIMGASFRKVEQVVALAGCDYLTISPDLLEELSGRQQPLRVELGEELVRGTDPARLAVDEGSFRWQLNADAMATEKLAEGIRRFHADGAALEQRALREIA